MILSSEWLTGVPDGAARLFDIRAWEWQWDAGVRIVSDRDLAAFRGSHTCISCGMVSENVELVLRVDKDRPFYKKKWRHELLCQLCRNL